MGRFFLRLAGACALRHSALPLQVGMAEATQKPPPAPPAPPWLPPVPSPLEDEQDVSNPTTARAMPRATAFRREAGPSTTLARASECIGVHRVTTTKLAERTIYPVGIREDSAGTLTAV